MPVIHAAQAGDGVDQQQRGVAGGVDGGANLGNAGGGAGARLVMDHGHRLDLMALILAQPGLDAGHIGAAAPIGLDEFGADGQAFGQFTPQMGEPASLAHQHPVAGAEGIGQGGLPGAGARGRVDHHRGGGLEDEFHLLEQLRGEFAEIGAAMVHGGIVHGAQDAVGHRRGAGDLQVMPAGDALGFEIGHRSFSCAARLCRDCRVAANAFGMRK